MNLDDILDDVAPIPEYHAAKRHSYVIVGKPGSGKTTLAHKMSELTRSKLINSDTCINSILQSANNENVIPRNIHILDPIESCGRRRVIERYALQYSRLRCKI